MSEKGKELKGLNFHTSIDIQKKSRKEIVDILNADLAASADLHSQTKQAHWNVKGAQFYQLHELFDDLAGGILDVVDMLAERATALGGYAMGTVRMSSDGSYLPDYECHSSDSMDHVKELVERYSRYAKRIREMIDKTAELGDQSTSDLYTEISRKADKYMWFLEAHLQ